MDILGTKDLIKNPIDANKLLETIKKIASNNRKGEILNRVAPDGVTENVKYEAEISSFSDHIVVSHPVDAPLAILSLTSIAVQIHRLVLEQGLLIRGAITKGRLYHDSNIVIGEALNNAVNLEETKAGYPRVILDESIVEFFEKNTFSIIEKDKDGKHYVAYLKHTQMFDTTCSQDRAKDFKEIRKVIIDNCSVHANEKIKEKWDWLIEKFNDSLSFHQSQYKIPQEFLDIQKI